MGRRFAARIPKRANERKQAYSRQTPAPQPAADRAASIRRRQMIRKLPEASAKLVREVQEQDGRIIGRPVTSAADLLAPDDDALEHHVRPSDDRMVVAAFHLQLCSEAE